MSRVVLFTAVLCAFALIALMLAPSAGLAIGAMLVPLAIAVAILADESKK